MSKLVTFAIGFFVNCIADWEDKKRKFFNNSKRSSHHSLINEMIDMIFQSESIQNDSEIDLEKLADSKIRNTFKKSLFRFLNQRKENTTLSFPIKTKRRSRNNLDSVATPPACKQTRFQSSKCQSIHCEWKIKYHEEIEKNSLLQNQIEELNKKLEFNLTQSSRDKSSQYSSNPYSQSTVPLLKTQQRGCIKQYSIEMFRLSIVLLVACNLSAEVMPCVLSTILTAAQLRHLDLPKIGYFLKVRSMLQPLNEKMIRSFCEIAQSITICFDESSFKKRKGQVLAVSVMNQAAEQKIVALVEHNERSDSITKYVFDVKIIMQSLRTALGPCLTATMNKTNMIMSDNCPSAKKTRSALKQELDEQFPVPFERIDRKCLVHVANLSEGFILEKTPLLKAFLKKIAPLLSPPMNASTETLHPVWTGPKIVYHHGTRFFVNGTNALSAFVSFDIMKNLMTRYSNSLIGATEISKLMENPELYKQLAVMSRLSIFVKELWRSVTVKQTKAELVENIQKIQCQIEMVSSETFSLDEIAEELPRNGQIDEQAHQKYLNEFSDNEDVQTMVRQVFVHFTTKIYDLMVPYLSLADSDESESQAEPNSDENDSDIIEPANIGVERCFGVMKFYEERFKNLAFGAMSQLTIAKCNRLQDELENVTDEELTFANRMARQNQQQSMENASNQRAFIKMNNERRLAKVKHDSL